MKRWIGGLALVVLLTLAAGVWWQRTPLLAWYYVHRLAKSDDRERDTWAKRVVGLDRAALPHLFSCLEGDCAAACINVQTALTRLADRWGPNDPRSARLAGQLGQLFALCSASGQQSVLEVEAELVRSANGPAAAEIVGAAARLLAEVDGLQGSEARTGALTLAAVLVTRTNQVEVLDSCRNLAETCLKDENPENRLKAVRLALQPGMGMNKEVVPLLHDPASQVRCAVLVTVGGAPDLVATDDLLNWLHDPDAHVRRLCEATLRGRGLQEEHIRLGRLLTDDQPTIRLQVLDHLRAATDLDPGAWLRRLSQDPAPAVRAAAIRAACGYPQIDLTERIVQIARSDPNPTVRQIAQYYLSCRQRQPSFLAN
jgi:hypothetical protein